MLGQFPVGQNVISTSQSVIYNAWRRRSPPNTKISVCLAATRQLLINDVAETMTAKCRFPEEPFFHGFRAVRQRSGSNISPRCTPSRKTSVAAVPTNVAVLQQKTQPLVDALEPWLRAKLGQISQKSKLAEDFLKESPHGDRCQHTDEREFSL
jgi:hypothetical protein